MVTKCLKDCEFYSTYTDTCDYTLVMYESRGCPTNACTKYKPRTKTRSWNVFRAVPENRDICGEGDAVYGGESGYQDDYADCRFIVADCGHEVYDGEYMYEWEGEKTLCPECVEVKFDELCTAEKAALLCCDSTQISFPPRLI